MNREAEYQLVFTEPELIGGLSLELKAGQICYIILK